MPEHPHPAAFMVTPQLDAYPRLCGLPVTVERVAARPARVTRPLGRGVAAFLVVAAVVLAGASVARAQAPAPTPTPEIQERAAAIIPPRIFPRVLPRPLRTPPPRRSPLPPRRCGPGREGRLRSHPSAP